MITGEQPAGSLDAARPTVAAKHVAITMDGNGRWAAKRNLARTEGHRKGADVAYGIIQEASRLGIEVLTLYAFSYENWQRDAGEVWLILEHLLPEALRKASREAPENNFRFRIMGDLTRLSTSTQLALQDTIESTANNTGMLVNIAVSYSGRREILSAVKRLINDIPDIQPDDLTEDLFSSYLDTVGLPDPDLHIRCGGVNRLSNLMLWQMAYTEQLSIDVLWPDFTSEHLRSALEYFEAQPRKFGRVLEDGRITGSVP